MNRMMVMSKHAYSYRVGLFYNAYYPRHEKLLKSFDTCWVREVVFGMRNMNETNNVAMIQAAFDAEVLVIDELVVRAEEIIGPKFCRIIPRKKRYIHWHTAASCIGLFLIAIGLFLRTTVWFVTVTFP